MAEALAFARIAYAEQEVPIGAVVVRDGRMIGRGRNRRERLADPTHHAEIEAIREAAREVGHWRLEDCTLYATLEPCPMCAGAAVNARIRRIVFGCDGPQGRILRHPRQHPGGRAAQPPAARSREASSPRSRPRCSSSSSRRNAEGSGLDFSVRGPNRFRQAIW